MLTVQTSTQVPRTSSLQPNVNRTYHEGSFLMNKNVQKLYHKILLVALFVMIGLIVMGHPAYGYADIGLEKPFMLDQDRELILNSYSYELNCNQGHIQIIWESEFTEDVTNYKIHRRILIESTDGVPNYDDSQWVTPAHMVAKPEGKYEVVDTSIEMDVDYNYRLYGFDVNLSLSNAKVADLGEVVSFHCFYLPMIYF